LPTERAISEQAKKIKDALGPLMDSRIVSCFDPGLEHGGIGNVCFKLTAEEKG
jgi:hypothetical protein